MEYLKILEENKNEMIEKLQEAVRIKSVLGAPYESSNGETYPFGEGVETAYRHIMELGRSMGFETVDFDHYGGHIDFKSDDPGAEIFGIAGHVDVVPEGSGWEHEAYGGVIEDGWMYGRGTTDDKGPLYSCLYAMKAIKDAGIKPKKTIRLIVGLDEETEKKGMLYYLDKAGAPDFGITPDGDFPLINGEMGIVIFELAEKLKKRTSKEGLVLSKLSAGEASNIVPAHAKAVVASETPAVYDNIKEMAETYRKETGYKLNVKKAGSSLAIESEGISAHGARPQMGLNAISILMDFLGRLEFAGDEINEFIAYYNDHIGFCLAGEKIGCALEDEVSGKLIFNVGIASVTDDLASVTVNIRYPVSNTADEVFAGIEKTLEGRKIGIVKHIQENPVFIELDDPFVVKLLEAYTEETGDTENKPQVIGGGTYAKLMNRLFCFGAQFPGEEDRMHQANERLSLDSYMKMARIYAKAIYKLCCE